MDADLTRRFGGVARLYGQASLERFRLAHISVLGIGGVGSWAAEALARSAVGRITLIDLDNIAESNVNRQIHALDDAFGKAKVTAMAERIRAIHPACIVTEIEDFITPDNLDALLPTDLDGVLDATDDVRAKAALVAYCRRRKLPLVMTGGAGGRLDPTCIKQADLARTTGDRLLAKVRNLLRRDYGYPRDPAKKFGVTCIYSDEPVRRPVGLTCDADAPRSGLNCAGYGSSVCVTAPFGFAAAATVLDMLHRTA